MSGLMELVCERQNLQTALKGVKKKNKESAGIDGMTVEELPEHLRAHWSGLREQLLSGTFRPAAVKDGRKWVVDVDLEKFFAASTTTC